MKKLLVITIMLIALSNIGCAKSNIPTSPIASVIKETPITEIEPVSVDEKVVQQPVSVDPVIKPEIEPVSVDEKVVQQPVSVDPVIKPEIVIPTPIAVNPDIMTNLTIYHADEQGYLIGKSITIKETTPQAIWDMLADEPKGVSVLDFSIKEGGVGYLDLSHDFIDAYKGGSTQAMVYIYEAVNTFTSINGCNSIIFLIDGVQVPIIMGMDNDGFKSNDI